MIGCTHSSVREMDIVCQLDDHLEDVVNKCWNYSGRADTPEKELMNAILGLVGEAGEVADCYKKDLFHTPKDYREKKLLEMGDVMFYWLKLAELEGFRVDEILDANRAKLASRHPEMGKVTERFGPEAIR